MATSKSSEEQPVESNNTAQLNIRFSKQGFFRYLIAALMELPISLFTIPLHGLALWLSFMVALPTIGSLVLQPNTAILPLVGLVFGPIAGFLTGFFGNMLSDFLNGWGFFWNWDVAFGLMGLIPGLMPQIKRWWVRILIAEGFILAGVLIGALFAAITEMVISGIDSSTIISGYFMPVFLTYALFALIFGPFFALIPNKIPLLIIDLFKKNQMKIDSQIKV